MGRFDRYMLQQLLMLFGFFALVLILVFWVNSAVSLLDKLLGNGQTAGAFLYLSMLSLPTVMSNVLAIAAFTATIFVVNRLSSESELVVVQASGYSPFRLARALVVFALFVTAMIAILSHVLVPMSEREGNLRRAELAQDLTAQFLTEGSFVHPVDTVTFYVREITPAKELLDIFLSATDPDDGSQQSYTATKALLVREDTGPMLLMFDGMAQVFDAAARRLSVTRFETFAYSLGPMLDPETTPPLTLGSANSLTLVAADAKLQAELRTTPAQINAEIHARNGEALLALAAVLIGYACLVVGGFSRFGLWRQILIAIVLLILVKLVDTNAARLMREAPQNWPAAYLPVLIGAGIAWGMLWFAATPHLRGGRRSGRSGQGGPRGQGGSS